MKSRSRDSGIQSREQRSGDYVGAYFWKKRIKKRYNLSPTFNWPPW